MRPGVTDLVDDGPPQVITDVQKGSKIVSGSDPLQTYHQRTLTTIGENPTFTQKGGDLVAKMAQIHHLRACTCLVLRTLVYFNYLFF